MSPNPHPVDFEVEISKCQVVVEAQPISSQSNGGNAIDAMNDESDDGNDNDVDAGQYCRFITAYTTFTPLCTTIHHRTPPFDTAAR